MQSGQIEVSINELKIFFFNVIISTSQFFILISSTQQYPLKKFFLKIYSIFKKLQWLKELMYRIKTLTSIFVDLPMVLWLFSLGIPTTSVLIKSIKYFQTYLEYILSNSWPEKRNNKLNSIWPFIYLLILLFYQEVLKIDSRLTFWRCNPDK